MIARESRYCPVPQFPHLKSGHDSACTHMPAVVFCARRLAQVCELGCKFKRVCWVAGVVVQLLSGLRWASSGLCHSCIIFQQGSEPVAVAKVKETLCLGLGDTLPRAKSY